MHGLLSLYSWRYPGSLIHLWKQRRSVFSYIATFWRTTNFSAIPKQADKLTSFERRVLFALYIGMAAQIILGVALIGLWYFRDVTGGWQFGLALILAYPIVWAHLLVLLVLLGRLAHPKAFGKAMICRVLEAQVRRLRKRHHFTVVAVAGSVGKTSTKIAIARVLQASRRVLWQEGNYNDRLTVPLIFFNHNQPHIFNILAWCKIVLQNERSIRQPYPYQMVVIEMGTDTPGDIAQFAYIEPELVVITAVTPEHMEYFGTLDAVAAEELSALRFAQQTLVNIDDTPAKYLTGQTFTAYGLTPQSVYHVSKRTAKGMHGQTLTFQLGKKDQFTLTIPLLGDHGARIALGAAAAAHMVGLSITDIEQGVAAVTAFAGRMHILQGVKGSTIIDDTYNASPVAFRAALDVLQSGAAPQRIAIIGSMNELGAYSPQAHREVGEYCDPTKLDWVVTIGPDAKEYLAPVAKDRGCQVKTFLDPYKAGRFVKAQLKEGAVILAKGSQNRVFAEEALKTLLADKQDEAKLVRQSAYWMTIKRKQFKRD